MRVEGAQHHLPRDCVESVGKVQSEESNIIRRIPFEHRAYQMGCCFCSLSLRPRTGWATGRIVPEKARTMMPTLSGAPMAIGLSFVPLLIATSRLDRSAAFSKGVLRTPLMMSAMSEVRSGKQCLFSRRTKRSSPVHPDSPAADPLAILCASLKSLLGDTCKMPV
eukprot:Pompholyxophrys_punicea_v1_NODE_188_length_2887_cov_6.109463.p4 type:complete len:165 gc:universal NODE_188_length_2887_cov_6.109463:1879-2373(+)